tara:strand:- start:3487 stop:3921 length:435 start_codon:yes stop_codon:yes gene_type:complete
MSISHFSKSDMKFVIREVTDRDMAVVDFEDGSWAEVPMYAQDSNVDFDQRVADYAPDAPGKRGQGRPSWLTEQDLDKNQKGQERVVYSPYEGPAQDYPQWYKDRLGAYGDVSAQIEFITEQGLEAWQEEVEMIKHSIPKTEEKY